MTSTEGTMGSTTLAGPPVIPHLLFSVLDYSIFTLMLLISAAIGVYFGFFGTKQDNTKEYILGGKTMKIIPIAMSLVSSHISGITVLAVPADIYSYGASYWLCVIAMAFVCIVTTYVYLPVFYKLQLTSSYEYLKHRFDRSVEVFSSFLYAYAMMTYMPIVIFIPALALGQVTGINIHWVTPIVCIVCIFYTTLGGLKAVVWTDTLQLGVMIFAMIAVIILGTETVGGLRNVFTKSYDYGRLDLFNFDLNPTVRTSFWSITIGMASFWIANVSVSQGCIQKFLSLPTMSSAKWAMVFFSIGILIMMTFTCLTGLLIFTKYADCDPLTTGVVEKADQLLPYYIMDVAGHIPGLPGLFIAGLFSAALSTMSAGLNTMAGTIYNDFIKPCMPKNTTEKRASNIMKLIVIVMGVFSTALVFVVEHLGEILPVAISFGAMANGPLLGMFTLGMLFPSANTKGVITGTISGLLITGWIVFVAQYHITHGYQMTPKLPLYIDECDFDVSYITKNVTMPVPETPAFIFRISFYYYSLIGCTVTVVVGYLVSLLTGGWKQRVHPDLLSPVIHWMLPKDEKYTSTYNTV